MSRRFCLLTILLVLFTSPYLVEGFSPRIPYDCEASSPYNCLEEYTSEYRYAGSISGIRGNISDVRSSSCSTEVCVTLRNESDNMSYVSSSCGTDTGLTVRNNTGIVRYNTVMFECDSDEAIAVLNVDGDREEVKVMFTNDSRLSYVMSSVLKIGGFLLFLAVVVSLSFYLRSLDTVRNSSLAGYYGYVSIGLFFYILLLPSLLLIFPVLGPASSFIGLFSSIVLILPCCSLGVLSWLEKEHIASKILGVIASVSLSLLFLWFLFL